MSGYPTIVHTGSKADDGPAETAPGGCARPRAEPHRRGPERRADPRRSRCGRDQDRASGDRRYGAQPLRTPARRSTRSTATRSTSRSTCGKPEGKKIFEQLVAHSDVVFDNFAPGALARLGLDYEWGRSVNPRIIYCSVKGFLPGPVQRSSVSGRAGADGRRARLPHRLQGPADARGRVDHRYRGGDLRRHRHPRGALSPRADGRRRLRSRRDSTKPSCSGSASTSPRRS